MLVKAGITLAVITLFFLAYFIMKKFGGWLAKKKNLTKQRYGWSILTEWIGTIISFTIFSFLSHTFTPVLLILQLLATLFSSGLLMILTSYFGFDSEEKISKFQILDAFSLDKLRSSLFFTAFSYLLILLSTLTSVVIFWIYPIGNITGNSLFILFFYLIPGLLNQVVRYYFAAYELLLPEVEKDRKDSLLISNFSLFFRTITWFAIPVVLVKVYPQDYQLNMPSLWIFFAIPFLLFLSFIVVPFFIGSNKYTNYVNSLLTDYKYFLNETLNAVYIPDDAIQDKKINILKNLLAGDLEKKQSDEYFLLYNKEYGKNTGKEPAVVSPGTAIGQKNKDKLFRGDIIIFYFTRMNELSTILNSEKLNSSGDYLKHNLEYAAAILEENRSGKSNISIIFLTLISAGLTYLLKVYGTDIISALQSLIK